jgi:cytochrome c biogenesis protein CcdA
MLKIKIIFIILICLVVLTPLFAHAQTSQPGDVQIKCLTNGNCNGQSGLTKFLQQSNYTLPLIGFAGLIDGINPCAIGMLILLLGYLMVFVKKPELMKKIGIVYITTIFFTYLIIGLIFTQTVGYLINLPYYHQVSTIIKDVILVAIVIAGLINIKDYFWYQKGVSLGVGKKQVPLLLKYIKQITVGGTIILGVLVTIFEMPCSLPLYIGTITILSGFFSLVKIFAYLILYNIMFIVPITIVFIILLMTNKVFEAKDLQERSNRYLKLMTGLSQILIAIVLYFL